MRPKLVAGGADSPATPDAAGDGQMGCLDCVAGVAVAAAGVGGFGGGGGELGRAEVGPPRREVG